MAIRRLKVSNFRSFNELDVELGDFNVLIGANASGKSNFIEIFRFLRDIRNYGLNSAVALQGGGESTLNLRLQTSKPLRVQIIDDQSVKYRAIPLVDDHLDEHGFTHVYEMTYGFSLDAALRSGWSHRHGWKVQEDRVLRRFAIHAPDFDGTTYRMGEELGKGIFTAWSNSEGLQRESKLDPRISEHFPDGMIPFPLDLSWFQHDELLLESVLFPILLSGRPIPPFGTINQLGVYRIDSQASQQAQPLRASAALTEDGKNLASILDRILADETPRKTLLNLIQFLLPFINSIGVQKFTNESLLLYVAEKYIDNAKLHAGLMSEGTIAAIALIVVLYFEDSPLVVFEDPDRGMHPKLMARVVEMMKEVSRHKQIIITTHHPEMVRYAGVENLLLVSRDKDGFSQISRPADKEMVKRFLENDIGIDELYVDDLLEV